MNNKQSIKDTLSVIRKALNENQEVKFEKTDDNILILNKLVNDDGTIKIIDDQNLTKKEIQTLLENKLDDVFEKYISKWLDNNLPLYLEKYFKNK